MSRIEVPGNFVFEDGKVTFQFIGNEASFGEITAMDQLRAVLVAIAQYGTQASIQAVLNPASDDSTEAVPGTDDRSIFRKAEDKMKEALSRSERSFQASQQQTAAALAQAQKDYETATTNATSPVSPE